MIPGPNPGTNFTINWGRTQIIPSISNRRNIVLDRAPQPANYGLSVLARLALEPPGGIRDGTIWSNNLPAGFVIDDRNNRPVHARMTYTAHVTYRFVYSWVRPGHNPPATVHLPPKRDRVIAINRIGSYAAVERELDAAAIWWVDWLARNAWYREALRIGSIGR